MALKDRLNLHLVEFCSMLFILTVSVLPFQAALLLAVFPQSTTMCTVMKESKCPQERKTARLDHYFHFNSQWVLSARLSILNITKFSFPQKYLCIKFKHPTSQFQHAGIPRHSCVHNQKWKKSRKFFLTSLRYKYTYIHPPSNTYTFICALIQTPVIIPLNTYFLQLLILNTSM